MAAGTELAGIAADGPPSGEEQHAVADDGRRRDLIGKPAKPPAFLAALWIIRHQP